MRSAPRIAIGDVVVEVRTTSSKPAQLERFIATYKSTSLSPHIIIEAGAKGLTCQWSQSDTKPLHFFIDVDKFAAQQFSFPAAKQGTLNQALGRRSKTILDATASWGADALLMCAQGYALTLLERNPIMALLLNDAMQRLTETDWAQRNQITPPQLIQVDAIDYLKTEDLSETDCVYLDPMFPEKRKKSAAANKYMQFLQWLLGAENDSSELATAAIHSDARRVVVKRPDYAAPLYESPSQRYSSKLVHYDVYLKS